MIRKLLVVDCVNVDKYMGRLQLVKGIGDER